MYAGDVYSVGRMRDEFQPAMKLHRAFARLADLERQLDDRLERVIMVDKDRNRLSYAARDSRGDLVALLNQQALLTFRQELKH